MKSKLLLLLLISLAYSTLAQKPVAASYASPKSIYADLLKRLKAGDTSIDFKALRIAYSQSKDASPYGLSTIVLEKKMNEAFREKRYKSAAKAAEDILKSSFVDSDAHAILSTASRELGDSQKADFH